ncbi:MAG: hypothetical protein WBM34_06935, partial [Woeseiaceae bacterium]
MTAGVPRKLARQRVDEFRVSQKCLQAFANVASQIFCGVQDFSFKFGSSINHADHILSGAPFSYFREALVRFLGAIG